MARKRRERGQPLATSPMPSFTRSITINTTVSSFNSLSHHSVSSSSPFPSPSRPRTHLSHQQPHTLPLDQLMSTTGESPAFPAPSSPVADKGSFPPIPHLSPFLISSPRLFPLLISFAFRSSHASAARSPSPTFACSKPQSGRH